MKSFLSFILRSLVSGVTMFSTWLISFFALDQGFWLSSAYSLLIGILTYIGIRALTHTRFLQKNGLTRREYKIVEENIKEAKDKIHRLQRTFLKVPNMSDAKHNFETIRVIYKIYNLTKKEPKRFFLVEDFYFSHLESLVELAEKHSFLASQPVKSIELKQSLLETKDTMDNMVKMIEKDLYHMIETDINTLNFEMDVAKKTIDRKK